MELVGIVKLSMWAVFNDCLSKCRYPEEVEM